MNPRIELLFDRLKNDKRLLIIVFVGILGVVLLALSELIPEKENTEQKTSVSIESTANEYEMNLEKRLTELIESVDGAGQTKVMVTVDCGDENVYATENKSESDKIETKYVLVENNGNDNGILLKVWMPEIRGIAVVCQGADSAKVREEITGIVTAVLGISTNRVNIAKMNIRSGG